MGKDVADNDVVIFKNQVRNGAYTVKSADSHNGITKDAVVDFAVQAVTEQLQMDCSCRPKSQCLVMISTDAGDIFEFDLDFLTFSTGKFNPEQIPVEANFWNQLLVSTQLSRRDGIRFGRDENVTIWSQCSRLTLSNPNAQTTPIVGYYYVSQVSEYVIFLVRDHV